MTATAGEDAGSRLAEAARAGERRALSRLLTAIESRTPVGEAALRQLYRHAGSAHLVGVTGPPGSGKSTLVAALVARAREQGRSAAVLAIDPSSPVTGGAILGDRVRMQRFAGDEGVFIRSVASRGHLGGLAGSTSEAAAILDACGFDLIFIETVGAGQSEVEVAAIADTTLVVQTPEMGDEVQAMKAGLLEVADIVVVNKSDRPGAERTASQLRAMLNVGAGADEAAAGGHPRPKRPGVLLASGLTDDGVAELLVALDGHRPGASGSERLPARRVERARAQVEGIVADRIRASLQSMERRANIEAILEAVARNELDPYAAADQLVALL